MTNLYRLTKDNHKLLFIGTNHLEKFSDLPAPWLKILREYNPTQLFVEMSAVKTQADQKQSMGKELPSREHLGQLGYLVNEGELPAINKISSFEKILLLSYSLRLDDKKNIYKKIARAYIEGAEEADIGSYLGRCAKKFEAELRSEVGEELFAGRLAFYEQLNDLGLSYSWMNLEMACDRSAKQIDDCIEQWLKSEIPALEVIDLETEEIRDQVSTMISAQSSVKLEFQKNLEYIARQLIKSDEEKYKPFKICYNLDLNLLKDIENHEGFNIRNNIWFPKFELSPTEARSAVCVGDYHFLGKNGILNYYSKLGYKVAIHNPAGIRLEFDGLKGCIILEASAASADACLVDIEHSNLNEETDIQPEGSHGSEVLGNNPSFSDHGSVD